MKRVWVLAVQPPNTVMKLDVFEKQETAEKVFRRLLTRWWPTNTEMPDDLEMAALDFFKLRPDWILQLREVEMLEG